MFKVFLLTLLVGLSSFAETVNLGTANTVTLRGEVNDDSAQTAAIELMTLNAIRGNATYPIYLVLDTPGGSIDAGESLIEVAKTIRNLKTISIFAASMGSAIAEALPGDRLMTSNGILMFHRAAGRVSGQFENGEMESRLDFYKQMVRRMEKRSADRMGLSLARYKKLIKNELWLTSDSAVSSGAADRIVEVVCSPALTSQTQSIQVEVFIFMIEVEYSKCPLLRNGVPKKGQSAEAVTAYQKGFKNGK
jgi:ATP-dependent protease ClpP protease subunit